MTRAGAFRPSGQQWEIRHGDQRAVIVEVGGGVRAYDVGAREVLQGYPADAMCDGARGAPLIPWPNRLADGLYAFDGARHRAALTEPDTRTAIHGLLRWRPYGLRGSDGDHAVTVGAVLHPSPGYPFALDVQIEYALDASGLSVATTARNIGVVDLPYAHGQHPYLSAGAGTLDECALRFEAATRIVTDSERKLPVGREPVAGGACDFRDGRTVGATVLDDPFTGLARDSDGRARVRLTGADGRSVELWAGPRYGYLQLFSGDGLAPGRRRTALAAEPMTAPPNAFATGEGVVRLAPGEALTSVWGVRLAG